MTKMLRWSEANHAAWKQRQAHADAAQQRVGAFTAAEAEAAIAHAGTNAYAQQIAALCAFERIALPVYEHRFCERRWRFDAAWLPAKTALEIEGGVWANGRHTRPQGFINDIAKYNTAVMQGWRVIRCLPAQLPEGIANVAALIREAA